MCVIGSFIMQEKRQLFTLEDAVGWASVGAVVGGLMGFYEAYEPNSLVAALYVMAPPFAYIYTKQCLDQQKRRSGAAPLEKLEAWYCDSVSFFAGNIIGYRAMKFLQEHVG